ncbi:MAG: sigma-70 family RNA polymerase sigma factor [Flavobacteriaceae bacterium]|nr:sigma-70 family RNA polymerase sigma factor [Flavobacteriaceae bacterium]
MGKVTEIHKQLTLVQSIKKNDPVVLKKLYQENYFKVEGFILKNSGSKPQAKDIYQEAFMAMYQNIKADKFTPQNETALQGYLYRIAKNKWTDFLRSSEFKKTTALESFAQVSDEIDEGIIEDEMAKNSQLEAAMNAFKKLGEECKHLLEVFYFQKKSMNEIALLYNIGEASARNKKYRCIQKLKSLTLSPN